MIKLKDAIHKKPTFSKVANYKLPTSVSEWNEEILKQFYSEVNYLPKELGTDVSVNSVDENKGYAKGSIVVFYGDKKINFPIIVKDFMLSPFDVFIHKDNDQLKYYPSNIDNIMKILASDKIAKLENYWGKGGGLPGVKPTGGVYPKQSVNIWDNNMDDTHPVFSKMSGWRKFAKKEDLQKLAMQMEANPDVSSSFVENTGNLLSNIVELNNDENRVVINYHKNGSIDVNDVVKAKQMVVAIDSEFIDTNKLAPIKPPSVCELRLISYPSMEDFIESGDGMIGRLMATKVGKPISGVVLDCKSICDMSNEPYSYDDKNNRSARDQVFISTCGCYISFFSDWGKTGIGFYGSGVLDVAGSVQKVIEMIKDKSSNDLISFNKSNKGDGSDRLFAPIPEMNQGLKSDNYFYPHSYNDSTIVVIYGSGDSWESIKMRGDFKKYKVNNSIVYSSSDCCIIPANVASIQKVSSVNDPVYKMIAGKCDKIYLVPESSLIINTKYMNTLDARDFMSPEKSVKDIYEKEAISKVAVCASYSDDGIVFNIDGDAFEPIKKIAGVNGDMSTKDTMSALKIMGLSKTASIEVIKVAANRLVDSSSINKDVCVYGVDSNYINNDVFNGREKTAKLKSMIKDYSYSLRKDLFKEASVLSDPESVDVVLSLNFINENSVAGYIENIEEMKKIQSEMCKMLIACRMGLSDIDESALKKSIDGLSEVIKGLEELKIATGKYQ